jgi:hypothetical protein
MIKDYLQFTIETFPDNSTIQTDKQSGCRTVFGKLAHDEYFKRLKEKRETEINKNKTN